MITQNIVLKVETEDPAKEAISKAASAIKAGRVIAFPTRCLYALGADAFNAAAVERIFKIKQRAAQNPILILIDHVKQLERLVTCVSDVAAEIMQAFWPGKVTLVFEASNTVPHNLAGGSGKIGIRLAGHPIASALIRAVAGPITGTSANLSGSPGCHRIADLESQITSQLDLILDAGPLKGGIGSTVVDVTEENGPKILREGEISARDIMNLVGD